MIVFRLHFMGNFIQRISFGSSRIRSRVEVFVRMNFGLDWTIFHCFFNKNYSVFL